DEQLEQQDYQQMGQHIRPGGEGDHHREGQRFIVTGWIDTITRVYVDARTGERVRYQMNPGDGTVPLHSAADGRRTSDRALAYSPAEHMQIFNEKSAMETVTRTIVGSVAPT